MKKISVILLLIFCSQNLLAQALPEMKPNQKRLDKYLQKDQPKEFIAGHWPLKPLKIATPADSARFSHTTALGSIYLSGVDNMPCLRPDYTIYRDEQMVELLRFDSPMPNAFRNKRPFGEKRP